MTYSKDLGSLFNRMHARNADNRSCLFVHVVPDSISENQKSIVLKLFVTNPSTNVIGDSKISDSIARKPVNFSSIVPCTSPCTHTRMFTWLAPIRTHARSPGDGDGPRRDELLLGAAVLAVCRCLRRLPGCERRSSWAP